MKSVGDIMIDGMSEIITDYCKLPESKVFELLKRFGSIRGEFEYFYLLLKYRKEIEPIENLTEEKKDALWNRVKFLKLPNNDKIKICIGLYCYELITKE